ncbi:MAG: hypothetical protein J6R06_08365 [Bacteroidales bacterium]|nr:hypothetical protein [Bacteroidales bacterium]
MELTKLEIFKAMNDKHVNLKDCEGMKIKPVAYHTHEYEDSKGQTHNVLVIKNGYDSKMYKTEVKAFIQKFMQYLEAFGDEEDENKPDILITINESKAHNKYVNFDLVEA